MYENILTRRFTEGFQWRLHPETISVHKVVRGAVKKNIYNTNKYPTAHVHIASFIYLFFSIDAQLRLK